MHAANNINLISVVDEVAREKNVNREEIFTALELGIKQATYSYYGNTDNINVIIDRKLGSIKLFRIFEVVEQIIDSEKNINITEALKIDSNAKIGETIQEELPVIDFLRSGIANARNIIVKQIKELEHEKHYELYKDSVGKIVNGVVNYIDFGNAVITIGNGAEAILPRSEMIYHEKFKIRENVRAVIKSVQFINSKLTIVLSRSSNDFLTKLLMQDIPEVYEGIVEIKNIARDPGSRAKIAVFSNDPNIDPVGACVGVRGSRVHAITNELRGEKLDIIRWSDDLATFIINALSPFNALKVIIDNRINKVEIVVSNDQQNLVIGRRGQNVCLISKLIGWNIDILDEQTESEIRQNEYNTVANLFKEALDVDEIIIRLLVAEGFDSIEEIINSPINDLIAIEGFNEELANEIYKRAENYLVHKKEKLTKDFLDSGGKKDLLEIDNINVELAITLCNNGIKSAEDFADLSVDEFFDIIGKSGNLSINQISNMIIEARTKLGWI